MTMEEKMGEVIVITSGKGGVGKTTTTRKFDTCEIQKHTLSIGNA